MDKAICLILIKINILTSIIIIIFPFINIYIHTNCKKYSKKNILCQIQTTEKKKKKSDEL